MKNRVKYQVGVKNLNEMRSDRKTAVFHSNNKRKEYKTMTFEERYIKTANRGEFQYEVDEADDCTGKILSETCRYKSKPVGCIRSNGDEFEVEIDNLKHDPLYIFELRSSRKVARELLERIIKNDELDNGKNMKYVY